MRVKPATNNQQSGFQRHDMNMSNKEMKGVCEESRNRLIDAAKEAGISYEPSQNASAASSFLDKVEPLADELARCPDLDNAQRILKGYCEKGDGYVVGFFLNYAQWFIRDLIEEFEEIPNPTPYFYLATIVSSGIKKIREDEKKRIKESEG